MTNNTTHPQAGPRPRHNKQQHQRTALPVTVDAPSPTKSKERKAGRNKSSLLKGAWVQLQTIYGGTGNSKHTNNVLILLAVFVLCSIILLHPTNNNADFHDIVQNTNNIPNPKKKYNDFKNTPGSVSENVPTRRPMMVKLRDDIDMHTDTTTTSNTKRDYDHNNVVIRVDMNEDKWKTFRQVDRSKDQMYALDKPVSSRDWRHRQSDTFVEG